MTLEIYKAKGVFLENQLHTECQLVTIINAASFYYPDLTITNQEYERLIDMTMGRHGSCIDTKAAIRYFNLETYFIKPTILDLVSVIEQKCCVETGIRHPILGNHSVLCTALKNGKEREFRVHNIRFDNNWIGQKEYFNLIERGTQPNIEPCRYQFRVFIKNRSQLS